MNKEILPVIKIGGTVAEDRTITTRLLREIAALPNPAVVVHGGGKAVSRISERLGLSPRFVDGVRITSPEEMEIVDMVLAGRVNTELVRAATREGLQAIGLTGADRALLEGALVGDGATNRTATVHAVHSAPVIAAIENETIPIVATVGIGTDGEAVNINADEAARAIALSLSKEKNVVLCYISDIPGVLDPEDAVIGRIAAADAEGLIADGTVTGGMAAKIRSSAAAVLGGISRVVIGGFRGEGDLGKLLRTETGTTIE